MALTREEKQRAALIAANQAAQARQRAADASGMSAGMSTRVVAKPTVTVAATEAVAAATIQKTAAVAAARAAVAVVPANPVPKPEAKPSREDALAAIAAQGTEEKKRADIISTMTNLKPYNGKVLIKDKQYPIVNGSLNFNGAAYQVSKDGRAVISNNLQLIGEIRGGVMTRPSAEFLNEMKFLGELK